MKDIIAAVKKAISDLRTKADGALKKLGPLDSLEVGREVLYGLNSLEWTVESLADIASQMDAIEAKLPVDVDSAAAKLIEEKIIAGEFVRKTDHDLALDQAKKDGETAATLSFADEKKNLETVTARRLKLTTTHGAALAATIPDTALQGDDAAFTLVEVEAARRVTETSAFGIDPVAKADAFKDIVTFAYDADGNKGFDARIAGLESLGLKRGAKGKDGVTLTQKTGTPVPPVTPPTRAVDAAAAPSYAF